MFYDLINQLSDVRIDAGAADYRLLGRKVVAVSKPVSDPFLFMRGLVAWLGFRQWAICYLPLENPRRQFGVGRRRAGWRRTRDIDLRSTVYAPGKSHE